MSGIVRQLDDDKRPGRRLRILYGEVAEAQMADGYKWLAESSFGGIAVAERFVDGLLVFVEEEADLQGTIPFDRPVASESPSEGVWYRLSYKTSKRATPGMCFLNCLMKMTTA